jgi:hypothetical protein
MRYFHRNRVGRRRLSKPGKKYGNYLNKIGDLTADGVTVPTLSITGHRGRLLYILE